MDISALKEQQFSNVSTAEKFHKKTRDQWNKVLKTFEIIRDKTSLDQPSPRRNPSNRKKKIIQQIQEVTFFSKNSPGRSILSSSFTNTAKEQEPSKLNLKDFDIVWSSSNEESDPCSSNSNKKKHISRNKKHLKPSPCETQIQWSSSESENEKSLTRKTRLSPYPKTTNSEYDLNLFIREIEKDLNRTKKIKRKITHKGEYGNRFQKAINKAKADSGFLDYEQKAEIISGLRGVITEKKISYGTCIANVQFETGLSHYICLGKKMRMNEIGSSIVCFLDDMHFYVFDAKTLYIQPNRVIRA